MYLFKSGNININIDKKKPNTIFVLGEIV